MVKKILILGASGRDFHDFNMVFRDNDEYEVVAFTQTDDQNLGELGDDDLIRKYPSELAGQNYPEGIPIYPESKIDKLITDEEIDEVVFSYSDVSHQEVMNKASLVLSQGADFRLIGPKNIMIESDKTPIIAIDAVRTGVGKSQLSQKITEMLIERDLQSVVGREPMPYGDVIKQKNKRFSSVKDLEDADVTIEEREEYEKHIEKGHIVYAGVDYEEILVEAEKEADVIVWEGGNNELPFFKPDLHFVLVDPQRPGHELRYHPGETNLRMADFVVINKENTVQEENIKRVKENIKEVNGNAKLVHTDSVVTVDYPSKIKNKEVLVVEDGPTLTHGGTEYGAGYVAAKKYGAKKLINPYEHSVGTIRKVLDKYDHIKNVLPALGYNQEQIEDLKKTIENSEPEVVVSATPHRLDKVIDLDLPILRVDYKIKEKNNKLNNIVKKFIKQNNLKKAKRKEYGDK